MFKYLASVTHLDTVYCILHSLISMETPKVVVKLKSKQKPRGGGEEKMIVLIFWSVVHTLLFSTH